MNKKDFSRNCLADAFVDLLEENTYEDISIQDIVDKAGFSRMAYYRNFNSKHEIIDYYLDNLFGTYIKKVDLSFTRNGPELFFTRLFAFFSEEETLKITKLLYKRGIISALSMQFIKRIQGGFIPNQSHYFYDFLAGGFLYVYLAWIYNGLKETPEEMVAQAMKYATYFKEKKVQLLID